MTSIISWNVSSRITISCQLLDINTLAITKKPFRKRFQCSILYIGRYIKRYRINTSLKWPKPQFYAHGGSAGSLSAALRDPSRHEHDKLPPFYISSKYFRLRLRNILLENESQFCKQYFMLSSEKVLSKLIEMYSDIQVNCLRKARLISSHSGTHTYVPRAWRTSKFRTLDVRNPY